MIYGLVFLLHGAPALSPFTKYNNVFNNLLFFGCTSDIGNIFYLVIALCIASSWASDFVVR
jgi:hypothetical protein